MAQFLLEIFSEEIPARMQRRAADDLLGLVKGGLNEASLSFDEAAAYSTPRRLIIRVEGLPAHQPDIREERKGPKVDAPQAAIDGFLKAAGVDSLDSCEKRQTPKGDVWFALIEKKGRPTPELLGEIISKAMHALPWPKSMRFASYGVRWVRPIRSILAIFDGSPVPGAFDLAGAQVPYSNVTRGHRFLSPEEIRVTDFAGYEKSLRDAHVIIDPAERERMIEKNLQASAAQAGLEIVSDKGLLAEVTGLVEWPVVLLGRIDDEFMDLPGEVLQTSMRSHQKYFSLKTAAGETAPYFAVVSNMQAGDGGKRIVSGNERVLRARLADARYFWDADRAGRLEDNAVKLGKIVFHAKLGSVAQRSERMSALATTISRYIEGCSAEEAARAAHLAKCDLVSGMVGEFPELQGLMGRYYALLQGESAAVADAIAEHYAPAGPSDTCPKNPVSVAVALAEKVDTLAGFWLIDEKPTGSKDPYALRRAALGIIRLVLENGIRLPLAHIFGEAAGLYGKHGDVSAEVEDTPAVVGDLIEFIADRLKVHLKEDAISHDLIASVFTLENEDDLVRLVDRVHALKDFLGTEDGANLLTAYRRAANILKAEEKKDGRAFEGEADPSLLDDLKEKTLHQSLITVRSSIAELVEKEDFAGAMTAMAGLRTPVDDFFDGVTVNADDAALRENRLRLLSGIRQTMGVVADFGQIEG